jgi:mRNA interferase MazF
MAETRPVVIVSIDALNERLHTVTICPLTSRLHPSWRSRLTVRLGRRDAEIAVDQIRGVSKSRIGAKLGTLSDKDAGALRRLITEMYGE